MDCIKNWFWLQMLDISGAKTIACEVQSVLHGLAIISSKFPLHPSHPFVHFPPDIVTGASVLRLIVWGKCPKATHLQNEKTNTTYRHQSKVSSRS